MSTDTAETFKWQPGLPISRQALVIPVLFCAMASVVFLVMYFASGASAGAGHFCNNLRRRCVPSPTVLPLEEVQALQSGDMAARFGACRVCKRKSWFSVVQRRNNLVGGDVAHCSSLS